MMEIQRPRILMVTATLGYGGAESSFLRLANFLSKHADVTIALMAQSYGSADYSEQQSSTGHRVVMLDEACSNRPGFIGKVLRWQRMLVRLRALKMNHHVTISFLSGPNLLNAFAGSSWTTIVSERGSKLYHTGIPPLSKFLWTRILDPMTYRRASKIVPASVGYAQEIMQLAGVSQRSKIYPIEGGIDAATLIANSEATPDPDIAGFCQGPTAVYCGRLDGGKGIDLLLPAFSQIHAKQPEARLLLIGDGPLSKEITAKCRSLGLSVTKNGDPRAAIFVAGYRRDPIRHFRLCHLFLFPSLHEGLGNALIEGVASGIPVLAADCPWGPRSILSGPVDEPPADWPVRRPVELTYGTLMPLPVNDKAVEFWAKKMACSLMDARAISGAKHRHLSVARFDIEESGQKWLVLVNEILSLTGQNELFIALKKNKGSVLDSDTN